MSVHALDDYRDHVRDLRIIIVLCSSIIRSITHEIFLSIICMFTMLSVILRSVLKCNYCATFRSQTVWQSYMKWMTRWNGEPGWTSWSASWMSEEHRSPVVPPSPRTPSICFGYTSTWRIGGASWRYARCSVVPSSPRCLT